MSHISRFEELIAWQKARAFTQEIYKITREGTLAKDWGLSGQMQRAAVSIMSNIAEGFERNKRSEFHQFLSVAKASCAEVRSQLYVALDCDYISQTDFERLLARADEVGKIVGALRARVEEQRNQERRL